MTLFNTIRFGFNIWLDSRGEPNRTIIFFVMFIPMIFLVPIYPWVALVMGLLGVSRIDFIHNYNKEIHGCFED